MKILNDVLSNWWTSSIGILLMIKVTAENLISQFDVNPDTIPDWNLVITAFITAVGFLFARDSSD
jgi:hypothetical protein